MLTEERYGKILSLLEEQGSVKVIELMQLFDASESTVRRDLNALDENGKLFEGSWRCNFKRNSFSYTG